MDIKIGKVTYDPSASEEKRRAESVKCPLQPEFGFRILGYRLHPDDDGNARVKDKNWGRTRTHETITAAFEEYLSAMHTKAQKLNVVSAFLHQLNAIKAWFESQRDIQLYSSSLLFVYEGHNNETPAIVKMIDFSHVFYEQFVDENYMHGLNYIINKFVHIEHRLDSYENGTSI